MEMGLVETVRGLVRTKEMAVSTPATRTSDGKAVYDAFMAGLEMMRSEGVERVVLTLYEDEPSANATGRFLEISKDTRYYPFKFLTREEQQMILDGKTYSVMALVAGDVGGFVKYGDCGVESYLRTHVIPMLPKLKPESNLNYVTEGGLYAGDSLKQFAKSAEESGWTPEAIDEVVKARIEEHHNKQIELMLSYPEVSAAIERIWQEEYGPFERPIIDAEGDIIPEVKIRVILEAMNEKEHPEFQKALVYLRKNFDEGKY